MNRRILRWLRGPPSTRSGPPLELALLHASAAQPRDRARPRPRLVALVHAFFMRGRCSVQNHGFAVSGYGAPRLLGFGLSSARRKRLSSFWRNAAATVRWSPRPSGRPQSGAVSVRVVAIGRPTGGLGLAMWGRCSEASGSICYTRDGRSRQGVTHARRVRRSGAVLDACRMHVRLRAPPPGACDKTVAGRGDAIRWSG